MALALPTTTTDQLAGHWWRLARCALVAVTAVAGRGFGDYLVQHQLHRDRETKKSERLGPKRIPCSAGAGQQRDNGAAKLEARDLSSA
ncbi:MAG: hypothetical protein C5B58_13715 [Acidobacteria bacterium]|nr:MAG: hypothetical protein C5B58_13715 [Acidobacteriota bacterium]